MVDTCLYYGRVLDRTMFMPVVDLAAVQTEGNQETMKELVQLLKYAATHPDAKLRYCK